MNTEYFKLKSKSKFTYLEYLEFSGVEEFRKFKNLPPITTNDIATVDMDELVEKLTSQ